ncbi:MAG TPA: Co2+/Mg2+ efflux protein ApaG [Methylophilus sp.]|nr:Co2+/Mg2+ efflux protein ApaG [Methylophilus sp.]HQQ33775.1 Co2+/Mg2+ efflux protein ApaG [Methylophilus sp.]
MASSKKYAFSVTVKTEYLSDQSSPEQQQYAFAYTITITNVGLTAAQLISRHWIITNAKGDIKEVKGLGVVGAQPLLEPQQQFEYTSGCVLSTPAGSMHGSYFCVAADGERFEVDIPEFILSVPQVLH